MIELQKIDKALKLSELSKAQLKELQEVLNELEFNAGTVDGLLGPKTSKAFDDFKAHYNLTHPGLIGVTTVDFLDGLDDPCEDEGNESPNQIILNHPLVVPSDINWNDFNCPVSKYFTVGEVTNWNKKRIPTDPAIIKNILKMARELDKIRFDYKGPISVTSWYRTFEENRRIGGARRSQHLKGGAVDIRPAGGKNLAGFQNWLDTYWYGALGYGAKRGFVHLDIRNNNGWKRGDQKGPRWNY